MHIMQLMKVIKKPSVIQSAMIQKSKCKNCTLEELAIINELIRNPGITQKELAGIIGKSERTVKTRTVEIAEKMYIKLRFLRGDKKLRQLRRARIVYPSLIVGGILMDLKL